MFIKFKFLDSKLNSCVVPIQIGTSSVLKVKEGTKLEVTPIQFSDLVKFCEGSTKVAIQEIDVKEFKGVPVEPIKDKEPVTKDVK